MTRTPRAEIRQRIVHAARELFRNKGVRGVTMADVAREADVTRQMVYKVFFDRRDLVLAAAIERIAEIADAASGAEKQVERDTFTTLFVELSIQIIESLRNDPELATLFDDGSPIPLHEALWTAELTYRAVQFWQPWLDFGRENGLLRNDLSNSDLADWLHTVYASIILRRNIPRNEERNLIQRFVVTSLAIATVQPGASLLS